jgi:hypothetical protein
MDRVRFNKHVDANGLTKRTAYQKLCRDNLFSRS